MRQIHFIGTIAIYSTLLMLSFALQAQDQNTTYSSPDSNSNSNSSSNSSSSSNSNQMMVDISTLEQFLEFANLTFFSALNSSFKANSSLYTAQINYSNATNISQEAEQMQEQYFNDTKQIEELYREVNLSMKVAVNISQLINTTTIAAMKVSMQANYTISNLSQMDCNYLYQLASSADFAANQTYINIQLQLDESEMNQQQAQNESDIDPTDEQLLEILNITNYLVTALESALNETSQLLIKTNQSLISAQDLQNVMTSGNAIRAQQDADDASTYATSMIEQNFFSDIEDQQAEISQIYEDVLKNLTDATDAYELSREDVQNTVQDLADAWDSATSAAMAVAYAAQTLEEATQILSGQDSQQAKADRIKAAKAKQAKARCGFAEHRFNAAARQFAYACKGKHHNEEDH